MVAFTDLQRDFWISRTDITKSFSIQLLCKVKKTTNQNKRNPYKMACFPDLNVTFKRHMYVASKIVQRFINHF